MKFVPLTKDPTEALKKEINQITSSNNMNPDYIKFKKLVGQYNPGYLYGNPKIHKDLGNPPYRPIISQIGTPGYHIAKQIDALIKPYRDTTYITSSTLDFLDDLQQFSYKNEIMASLDAKDLFTNIPVDETIDIIMNAVTNHPYLPPLNVDLTVLRKLLVICTK